MSLYSKHPTFYNQPVLLSDAQKHNPYGVIVSFFVDHRLSELREFLSQVVETCLTTDEAPFDEATNRADLLCYLRDTEILLEATYLVSLQYQDKDLDIK